MPTDRDLALVKAALEAAANRVPIEHKRAIRSLDPAAIAATVSAPVRRQPGDPAFDGAEQHEIYLSDCDKVYDENSRLRQRIAELERQLAETNPPASTPASPSPAPWPGLKARR